MEEGVFMRDIIGRDTSFQEWVRHVMGERRGEAPYELLRAWRRTFQVPDKVPYETCALIEVPHMGFYLRTSKGRVLVFAHIEERCVLMYHPTELSQQEWYDWRNTSIWPWPASFVFVPDWYTRLPKDVRHYIFCKHVYSNYSNLIYCYRAPICKTWINFWDRIILVDHQAYDRVRNTLIAAYGDCLSGLQSLSAILCRITSGIRHIFDGDYEVAMVFLRALQRLNPGTTISIRQHTDTGTVMGYDAFPSIGKGVGIYNPTHLKMVAGAPGIITQWIEKNAQDKIKP